ncbi:hypothetical protein [Brevibacillus migulae]|uniref:hypothetical protein n=1 Tax=Brevibacillus migulae TaxID=1644114 RepID=UPI0014311612|nr:hypothetical protein [Brevibacillus migulae]
MDKKQEPVLANRPSHEAWRLSYRLIIARILPRIISEEREQKEPDSDGPPDEKSS